MQKPPAHIFVVAGEPSGDILGAAAITSLLERMPSLKISGVGGPLMEKAGRFRSIMPMRSFAVFGLGVLRHAPRLLRHLRTLARAAREADPDVILTFDSPELAVRLHRRLAGTRAHKVHVVAPSVWTWRPRRAKKWARVLDHLCTLFPFEPSYFQRHGLQTTHVGHPALVRFAQKPTPVTTAAIKKPMQTLLLMPGSRVSEVRAMLPAFCEVARKMRTCTPGLEYVLLTLPHLKPLVTSMLIQSGPHAHGIKVCTQIAQHADWMKRAHAALVASGTASLELGLAGCPMVVAYRANPLAAWILKRLIRTPFVALPNIIAGRKIVPECLQKRCTPHTLLEEVKKLWVPEHHAEQRAQLEAMARKLQANRTFGDNVAAVVMEYVGSASEGQAVKKQRKYAS